MQASFETPWFAAGDGCNMSFFYHMSDRSSGNNMGTLLVEVKTVDKTWFAVFWKAGSQGDKWLQGNVDLSVSSFILVDKLGRLNSFNFNYKSCSSHSFRFHLQSKQQFNTNYSRISTVQ